MILYSAISSANIFMSLPAEIVDTTAFIYNMNRSGPRTDPWGTPEVTGRVWELTPVNG